MQCATVCLYGWLLMCGFFHCFSFLPVGFVMHIDERINDAYHPLSSHSIGHTCCPSQKYWTKYRTVRYFVQYSQSNGAMSDRLAV